MTQYENPTIDLATIDLMEPLTKQVMLRLRPSEARALARLAFERECFVSDILREAIGLAPAPRGAKAWAANKQQSG